VTESRRKNCIPKHNSLSEKIMISSNIVRAVFVAMSAVVMLNPTLCKAAVAIQEVPENKDHPGACYIEETRKAYQIGESWQPEGVCWQQTCHDFEQGRKTKTFLISFNTCGLVYAEPPCVLMEDASAPYPDCCPKYVCPPLAAESENEIPTDGEDYDVTRQGKVGGDDYALDYEVTVDDQKDDYDDDKFPSPLFEFYKYKYGIRI